MVEFKSSELSERNYREGDSVFIKFEIRRLNEKDKEIWLYCEENNGASLWLNSNESVLHGEPYMYKDGDIVNYNGNMAKVIKGFDDQWYVLTVHGIMLVLDPTLITCIIFHKEDNVL